MKQSTFVNNLKEASSCIRKFEAESKDLKEKIARSGEDIARLNKEAEALKIAMELTLDDVMIQEVMDKFATLKTKDLNVVKEAMSLDLTKKTASIGDLYEEKTASTADPIKAFMSILSKN